MGKDMKISIIIPVYNASAYICRCVRSALSQKTSDMEILLINDGSTDNSLEVCRELAASDARVKVYDKPNGGVSDARNYGIDHATGDYLMFIDADDWLSEETLDICMPYIPEYDIVRFSAISIYSKKRRYYKLGRSSDKDRIIRSIIKRATIVGCWGALFRKQLFTENNIRFDRTLRIGEDWLVTAQVTKACTKIKLLPDAYCYMYDRTNTESCTMTMNTSKLMNQFDAMSKIREVFPEGYRSEFSYIKCMLMQELTDGCGLKEAGKLLYRAGYDLTFHDILNIWKANISIRKKFLLLRLWMGGYIR